MISEANRLTCGPAKPKCLQGQDLLPAFLRQTTTAVIQTPRASRPQDFIPDFHPDKETLLYLWDDTQDATPPKDVSLRSDPKDPRLLEIVSDGQVLARVQTQTAVTEAEIALMPLRIASQIGLSAQGLLH